MKKHIDRDGNEWDASGFIQLRPLSGQQVTESVRMKRLELSPMDELLSLAAQKELSDDDRCAVSGLYEAVCDMDKGDYRDDCLTIIKYRLWNM